MNLRKLLFVNNDCYKAGKPLAVKGIIVHSTGANNPTLRRYVGPDDGLLGVNQYNNHWNTGKPDGRQVCVHAFIGKLADGSVATYQTLPWDMRGWHGGSGTKGSVNDTHIGFEMCEDGLTDAAYFGKVYQEALELCAYLCKQFNLNPTADGVIIGHFEGYKRGIASNHGDPNNWLPKHGKSMDGFRAAVAAEMAKTGGTAPPTTSTPTPSTGDDATMWALLKGKGLNDYAIAGIMGNLYAESGLKATNLQNSYEKSLNMTDDSYTKAVDSGVYSNFVKDCAGYGLAQWTYSTRKQALLDFAKAAKLSIGDFKMQIDFLWKELHGYTEVMNVLKTAKTVAEASNIVLMKYENPADQSAAVQKKRTDYGQGYYNKFAAPSTGGGKTLYRVQCGAFTQKANAVALEAKLKAKGFDTYIVQTGGYYKVQCGAFEVKANADKLAATLKSQGFETFITT